MIKVEVFHSRQSSEWAASVGAAVEATTEQANTALALWQQCGLHVNVLATSAQLTPVGKDVIHVLTLVVDVQPSPQDEAEEITYQDTLFE